MLFLPNLYAGLDQFVSGFAGREKLFRDGLGDLDFIQGVPERHPRNVVPAQVSWDAPPVSQNGGVTRQAGSFTSPAADWLPLESKIAQIEMIRPAKCNPATPVFVHFAATGDETFLPRRMLLANALAEQGIASVLLMNPLYGVRRPKTQRTFAVPTVSDQLRMNGASIF